MNLDDARLVPLTGEAGLACRFPGVVLYCAARGPAEAVADLIGRCRQAAGGSSAPGGPLARQLAGLLATADPSTIPGFAVAARTADGIAVLLNGHVDVDISGETGDETLSGAASITWVDRLLVGRYSALAIHPTGSTPEPGAADVDLIEGVVPASGLWIGNRGAGHTSDPAAGDVGVAAPAPGGPDGPRSPVPESGATDPAGRVPTPGASEPLEEESEPVTHPADDVRPGMPVVPPDPTPSIDEDLPGLEQVDFESVMLHDGHDHEHGHEHDHEREPLPVEPDPAEVRAAESDKDQVMVQGVVCSRGHFNDPRSRFCLSCGISMVHQTQNLVPGPRPPLGVLVFEDGTTYALSTNYVVGRQPDVSPQVQSGEALPLVLEDSGRTISRAHAELRLAEWEVQFVNLSRTNGSFVWDTRSGQWFQVTDQPVVLGPGTRIAMGRRTAVFESALVR